jgi:hypothetical protein
MKLSEILANKDGLNGEIIEYDGFLVGLNRKQKYLQYFSDIGLLSVHQSAPRLFLAQDQRFMRYLLGLFILHKLRAAAHLATGDESFQLKLKCTGKLKFVSEQEIYLAELSSLELELPLNPNMLHPIRTGRWTYQSRITYGEIALQYTNAIAQVQSQTVVKRDIPSVEWQELADLSIPVDDNINKFVLLRGKLWIERFPIDKVSQYCSLILQNQSIIALKIPVDSLVRDITSIGRDLEVLNVEVIGKLVRRINGFTSGEGCFLTELQQLTIFQEDYIFPPWPRKPKDN